MLTIIAASSSPRHANELYRWFDVQWYGDEALDDHGNPDGKEQFDRPETWIAEGSVPDTLLAMADEQLIGGLAFCLYPKPGIAAKGVWINGLFVQPEYRRKGTGSLLVQHAESAAMQLNEPELFVYSHMPHIYERLGWQLINRDEEACVLKKSFHVS